MAGFWPALGPRLLFHQRDPPPHAQGQRQLQWGLIFSPLQKRHLWSWLGGESHSRWESALFLQLTLYFSAVDFKKKLDLSHHPDNSMQEFEHTKAHQLTHTSTAAEGKGVGGVWGHQPKNNNALFDLKLVKLLNAAARRAPKAPPPLNASLALPQHSPPLTR